MNTPPPKGGGFKLRLKAGLVRHSADSRHIEVVIWFRRLLVLYVLDPYVVSHVSAARYPVAPAPQVLAQYRLRSIPNSLNSLCELRPFRYCTARDTDRLGGIDTSICT